MSPEKNTGGRMAGKVCALALASLACMSMSFAQSTPESWTVVKSNAMFQHGQGLSEYVAQQLKKELGEDILLWQGEGDQTAEATRWALGNAPNRRAVLMLTEGSSTVMGPVSRSYHLANFEPVTVFMEMPWCLFALKNSPAVKQTNVFRWLSQLQRPVTIAVGVPRGKPMLWVHALTRNSSQSPLPRLSVKAQLYAGSEQMQQVLKNGADIAIGRCVHIMSLAPDVMALGVAQQNTAPYLAGLPLFTDLGLPPLSRGWYGAFVPASMAASDKQRAIAAMQKIVGAPEVKKMIVQQGLTPLQLDYAASKAYIEEYKRTWQSVSDLLGWDGVDTSIILPAPGSAPSAPTNPVARP